MELSLEVKTDKKNITPKDRGVEKIKKKLIVIGIILIILVVGILGVFYSKNSKQKASEQGNHKAISVEETARNVSQIVKDGNFNDCNSIQDAQYKIICINNIARNLANKELDPRWCLELDNEMMLQKDCISKIVYAKTMKEESVDACNLLIQYGYNETDITECQFSFWFNLALVKKDIEVCNNFKVAEDISACKDRVEKTLQYIEENKVK